MPNNPFAGKPAEQANVEAPVETPQVDGEKSETERTYTGADLEQIVKDRLKRERKKLSSEYETRIAELEKRTTEKVSSNVEADLRSKLSAYEAEKAALAEKLTKYQTENLKATIERSLNAQDCLDPEVVIDHFMSRNLVSMGDDGEIVVENASGRLDDLVKDYLDKKPHLRKGTSKGGTGSIGPKQPAAFNSSDPVQMTTEELRAMMGGIATKKKNPFSR